MSIIFFFTTVIFAILYIVSNNKSTSLQIENSKLKKTIKNESSLISNIDVDDLSKKAITNDYNKKMRFELAGSHIEEYKQHLWNLKESTKLSLVPEPSNKYDKNAISVKLEGTLIGYVPKTHLKGVKSLMDDGFETLFVEKVDFWSSDEKPDDIKIYVKVYLPYKF